MLVILKYYLPLYLIGNKGHVKLFNGLLSKRSASFFFFSLRLKEPEYLLSQGVKGFFRVTYPKNKGLDKRLNKWCRVKYISVSTEIFPQTSSWKRNLPAQIKFSG